MDTELFALAIDAAVNLEREKGIGTLSEGVLHSAVKYYYQPDPGLQEVSIDGFVCDAIAESHSLGRTVIEVQTASFRNLKKKLSLFFSQKSGTTDTPFDAVNHEEIPKLPLSELSGLHHADFPGTVTVVHPMDAVKRTVWIDPETGVSTVGKRSPIGFIPARCLYELYHLREYIGDPRFRFVILGLEITDQKLLTGRSKDRKKFGARRIARIPQKLMHELIFEKKSDYLALIPRELPENFTSAEFRKATKLSEKRTSSALYALMTMGLLTREKQGKRYLYARAEIKDNNETTA